MSWEHYQAGNNNFDVGLCRFLLYQPGAVGLVDYFGGIPVKNQGLGTSIGSFSNWVFNSIVAFTFFKIVRAFTLPGTDIILENNNVGNPAGAF